MGSLGVVEGDPLTDDPFGLPPIRFAVSSQDHPAFKFHAITDILSLPDPEWLIEGILIKNSFAVLYGPAGSGKTFVALAWAFAAAGGQDWLGRKVNGGPVVYIAAEGGSGFKVRILALQETRGYTDDTPCQFLTEPVMFKNSDQVFAFVKEMPERIQRPALIVIDTLARCFVGGDENTAKEMGEFIFGTETIRRRTGATILLIHHSGKDIKSGARGSSALVGAADTIIKCTGGDFMTLGLTCEKQKDFEEFPKIDLQLEKVDLGSGRSSCVVEPFDPIKAMESSKTDAKDEKILSVLEEKFGPEGGTASEWQKACEKEIGVPHATFYKRLRKLKKQSLVEKEGEGQGARYRLAKSEPVSVSG